MSGNQHSTFRRLHQRGNPFILINVWDIGTARLAQNMGAQAIATSSAALAYTLGKTDGTLSRAEALHHAGELARAVDIPVSADLENGYGASADEVADAIGLAAQAGLAGVSIEDTVLPAADTAYPFELAVERIRAAAAAARRLPHDFVLVARADGVMTGAYDSAEAMRRLAAFEEAGADCLYAPLMPFDMQATLCQNTALPVNVLISGDNTQRRQSDYAAIGAARLSLGSSLARATHSLMHDTIKAMLQAGDFSALGNSISSDVIDGLITAKS